MSLYPGVLHYYGTIKRNLDQIKNTRFIVFSRLFFFQFKIFKTQVFQLLINIFLLNVNHHFFFFNIDSGSAYPI